MSKQHAAWVTRRLFYIQYLNALINCYNFIDRFQE